MSQHAPFTITREDDGDRAGRLVLSADGKRIGSLDYRQVPGGPIYIDFVEVLPSTQGAGLGRRLVEAAVAWARESHRQVVPVCSYARAVIEGDVRLRDVL